MNGYDFVLKMFDLHPGAVAACLLLLTVATWRTAVLHTNLRYMRENIVTKKDLALALSSMHTDFEKWVDDKFVTRRECKVLLKTMEGEDGD